MIKSIVQLYVDGDDNSDDEPCDEAWQISCMHLISMSHVCLIFLFSVFLSSHFTDLIAFILADEEVALPATVGCGSFKHIVGDTCVLDGPFTLILGDGSVITAPSLKKKPCIWLEL